MKLIGMEMLINPATEEKGWEELSDTERAAAEKVGLAPEYWNES